MGIMLPRALQQPRQEFGSKHGFQFIPATLCSSINQLKALLIIDQNKTGPT